MTYKFTTIFFIISILISGLIFFTFTSVHIESHSEVPVVVQMQEPAMLEKFDERIQDDSYIAEHYKSEPETLYVPIEVEKEIDWYEEAKHWFPQLSPFLLIIVGYYFDKKKKQRNPD